MGNITDWLMVGITAVYVAATIIICISNRRSAKAARESVEESRKQFEKNVELQRQHNYDSIRPAVSIDYASNDDGTGYSGSITVTNHGLGPAVIRELRFISDGGRDYRNAHGYCPMNDFLAFRLQEENEQMPVQLIFHEYYSKEFRDDSEDRDFLGTGESLPLLRFAAKDRREGDVVARVFHGVRMELVYTDLYGSRDWTTVKRLGYFKPEWYRSAMRSGDTV